MLRYRQPFLSLFFCLAASLVLAACTSDDDNERRTAAILDKPGTLLRLADTALAAQDYPAAANFYGRAILNGGDGLTTRVNLGNALLGSGNPKAALLQFEAARVLKPDAPEPDLGVGRVYLAEHKPQEALTALQGALQKGGRDPALYNNQGIALDFLRRHGEAQDAYHAGLAMAPDDRQLLSNLGLSLALSGKYPESIKILTDLAQEPDATPRMRQNLALALGMSGDKEAARRVASHDLGPEAVENNLRYYAAIRGS